MAASILRSRFSSLSTYLQNPYKKIPIFRNFATRVSTVDKYYPHLQQNGVKKIEQTLASIKENGDLLDSHCINMMLEKCSVNEKFLSGLRFFIWAAPGSARYQYTDYMHDNAIVYLQIDRNPKLILELIECYRDEGCVIGDEMFKTVLLLCGYFSDTELFELRNMAEISRQLGSTGYGGGVVDDSACHYRYRVRVAELLYELHLFGHLQNEDVYSRLLEIYQHYVAGKGEWKRREKREMLEKRERELSDNLKVRATELQEMMMGQRIAYQLEWRKKKTESELSKEERSERSERLRQLQETKVEVESLKKRLQMRRAHEVTLRNKIQEQRSAYEVNLRNKIREKRSAYEVEWRKKMTEKREAFLRDPKEIFLRNLKRNWNLFLPVSSRVRR